MLEVVFNDSTKGAIKMAKNYCRENMLGGASGYIGRKPSKKELEKRFEGKAVGGSSQDVVCIGLNLDIGDISGEIDGQERIEEFIRVLSPVNVEDNEVERFFKSQREDFERLLAAAKSGEPIRVWKSNAPFSASAFAFLLNALQSIECRISMVLLPEFRETSDNIVQSCADWSEVMPGQFYRFLPLEREISDAEKCLQSSCWDDLKAENAPLRALVNGRLISVPEDFYDHIIIKSIPGGEFVMAKLIGTILGRYHLGVMDGWYALRIRKMIAENKLEVTADKDASHPYHPYGKILRKAVL